MGFRQGSALRWGRAAHRNSAGLTFSRPSLPTWCSRSVSDGNHAFFRKHSQIVCLSRSDWLMANAKGNPASGLLAESGLSVQQASTATDSTVSAAEN